MKVLKIILYFFIIIAAVCTISTFALALSIAEADASCPAWPSVPAWPTVPAWPWPSPSPAPSPAPLPAPAPVSIIEGGPSGVSIKYDNQSDGFINGSVFWYSMYSPREAIEFYMGLGLRCLPVVVL